MKTLLCAVLAILGISCATTFTGDAHVPKGVEGCRIKCSQAGLDFAGMVFMGEYTDGCICHERGQQVTRADVSATVGASADVMRHMRDVHTGGVPAGAMPH
ncbi:MAG TPA: hypothetical protein VNO21_04740 [Polyangiaceae bacterium]|nr:hypothetical protein [Polyangiaceae bacterium]